MIQFGGIPSDLVVTVWDKCKELLQPILDDKTNPCGEDDYRKLLDTDTMQLWVAADDSKTIGVVITSIDKGSNAAICMVHCVCGKRMQEWSALFDETLIKFAKSHNCIAVKASARRGFKKILPDLIEDAVIYTRMLSNNDSA